MATKGEQEEYVAEAIIEYRQLYHEQYGMLLSDEEAEKQLLILLAFYKALLPNELFEPDELGGNV